MAKTLKVENVPVVPEIMEKRDNLIDALEERLKQKTTVNELFTVKWAVI